MVLYSPINTANHLKYLTELSVRNGEALYIFRNLLPMIQRNFGEWYFDFSGFWLRVGLYIRVVSKFRETNCLQFWVRISWLEGFSIEGLCLILPPLALLEACVFLVICLTYYSSLKMKEICSCENSENLWRSHTWERMLSISRAVRSSNRSAFNSQLQCATYMYTHTHIYECIYIYIYTLSGVLKSEKVMFALFSRSYRCWRFSR
jgi:hypothetical protein